MKLNELQINELATVTGIKTDNIKVRRRLRDMGIVIGRKIKVKGKAPMGYPIDVYFAGYDLTLRKNEAECIEVKKVKE